MPHTAPSPARRLLPAMACLACGLAASGLASAAGAQMPAEDASSIVDELREMQKEFEEFRASRIPVERRAAGGCDQWIGRMCIWFGGEENESFPAEFREVQQARVELIRSLTDGFEQVPDPWILGQLVHYLVERSELGEAERFAEECGLVEAWWCAALKGYVLHVRTEYFEAEGAFREALRLMPDDLRREWTAPRYVFSSDAVERFDSAEPAERTRQFELLWRLSDPLFLFEGNDRLTDHFARLVEVEFRKEAADPMGLEWEADLAETLVRYGRNTGYSRTIGPRVGFGLQDTRRVVGHHHPKSRGYLFPEDFLESPAEIPPESWITAPRVSRTWYAPPYAPDVRALETQVGRFRRGDRMLVVGAYRPTLPAESEGRRVLPAWRADGGIEGTPYAAFFLVPEDGSDWDYVQGRDPEGVLTLETEPGRYVSSLEVVDLEGRQAWRARQGVIQRPLVLGLVGVSDLMILKPGAPLPSSLDEALADLRPGIRVRAGERFPVIWEVYGLGVEEPVTVTVGFSRGRPGFLERVGDFLGLIEPEGDVDITFQETGPQSVQTVFRAVELSLPDLDPGEYTLHLRLDLVGRTPVVTSRPIIVEE